MNENNYQPHFEISKRYIEFSAELLRLSLLAISGIFYLLFISDKFKDLHSTNYFIWIIVALILFTISSGFALAHRYYATDFLSYYIAHLRHNDPKEKEGYKKCLKWSRIFIICCQYSFGIALLVSFIIVLLLKSN